MKNNSKIMRVPYSFHKKAHTLAKKYGYKETTKFLEKDGVKILENADAINDMFGMFLRKRKR